MSEMNESDLIFQVINLQHKLQKLIGRALAVHGIGVTEYLVLHQLSVVSGHKLRRSDLAELVGLSPSGVTRLLNPMEKIGLVEKEHSLRDARVSFVSISSVGKKIYKDAKATFDHACTTFLEPLNLKQRSALAASIQALV